MTPFHAHIASLVWLFAVIALAGLAVACWGWWRGQLGVALGGSVLMGAAGAGGEAAAWEIYYQAVTCLQGHEADLCSVGFDAENSIWGIALFLEVCAIGALSAAGAIGQVREMQGGRERYWPVARSRY